MKKVLIIDLCNTLADVNGQLIIRGFDPTGHAIPVGTTIFEDETLYMDATPWKPAFAVVDKLVKEGYEPMYLTARPLSMLPVSKQWLDKHKAPEGFIYCSAGTDKKQKLHEIFENGLPDELIIMEDSPKEIENVSKFLKETGIPGKIIVPRHEYNAHIVEWEELLLHD